MEHDYSRYFEFAAPEIPPDRALGLKETHLNDIYADSNVYGRFNAFFHLLNQYHYLKGLGLRRETAHLCHLLSYYLFIALTPPHSMELALHYAREALELDWSEEREEWLRMVERGN